MNTLSKILITLLFIASAHAMESPTGFVKGSIQAFDENSVVVKFNNGKILRMPKKTFAKENELREGKVVSILLSKEQIANIFETKKTKK